MARCEHCRGKFGLIRHTWWGHRFCSNKCRSAYLDKLARDRERLKAWFGFLARGSPFR